MRIFWGCWCGGNYLRYGDWGKCVLGRGCQGELELLVIFETDFSGAMYT